MFDLTTLTNFAAAWGVVLTAVVGYGLWRKHQRSKQTAIEDLRATIRARRENLRRAAGTEYRDRRWER